MTDEITHIVDSGPPISKSSGHFAPRVFNGTAADPVAGYYRSTAGAAITIPTAPERDETASRDAHSAVRVAAKS
jgi:hypothetical protein